MLYNLLVIDDDMYTLEDISLSLNKEKLSVKNLFLADSVRKGIQFIEENCVHIVLCDIDMPGESGFSFVQHLEQKSLFIPCIMITCHSDFGFAKEACHLNCFDYILKPIDYDELGACIMRAETKVDPVYADLAEASVQTHEAAASGPVRNSRG